MASLCFYLMPLPGVGYWFYLLPLVGAVLAIAAQSRVQSAFRRYSQVATRNGWTGAEVARSILDARGLQDVKVEETGGVLSDHYDPTSRTLRLSQQNYQGRSVAAVGVAAHEAGHALQHADAYAWLTMRSQLVPVVGIGSRLAGPLIFLGVILSFTASSIGTPILVLAAAALSLVVVFSLVTLPVELDASRRALRILADGRILAGDDELDGARKMLDAAALTYVASAAVAILELLRILMLLMARRD